MIDENPVTHPYCTSPTSAGRWTPASPARPRTVSLTKRNSTPPPPRELHGDSRRAGEPATRGISQGTGHHQVQKNRPEPQPPPSPRSIPRAPGRGPGQPPRRPHRPDTGHAHRRKDIRRHRATELPHLALRPSRLPDHRREEMARRKRRTHRPPALAQATPRPDPALRPLLPAQTNARAPHLPQMPQKRLPELPHRPRQLRTAHDRNTHQRRMAEGPDSVADTVPVHPGLNTRTASTERPPTHP